MFPGEMSSILASGDSTWKWWCDGTDRCWSEGAVHIWGQSSILYNKDIKVRMIICWKSGSHTFITHCILPKNIVWVWDFILSREYKISSRHYWWSL